jgi:hypothetical protein
MKRTENITSFKTPVIDTRTGERTGTAKHYVWADEHDNGERVLLVRKLTVSKAEYNVKYSRVIGSIGLRIEHLAFKFDTLFSYFEIAIQARKEFETLNASKGDDK